MLQERIIANASDDEAYFLLGNIHWKHGRQGEAMSCFLKAVAINPDSPAKVALEHAREVSDFFNPDIYNP